jgi:hypothetical protein
MEHLLGEKYLLLVGKIMYLLLVGKIMYLLLVEKHLLLETKVVE